MNRLTSGCYERFVRPLLFRLDPERAHHLALRALQLAPRIPGALSLLRAFAPNEKPTALFGLQFRNPIGLAAGFDKNGVAIPAWEALGFGFVELGGVTWHPQAGNPAPRMFRAVADEALINRLGFNNPGAEAIAAKLTEWRSLGFWPKHPVGINLGKSKIAPLERAAEDYASSFRALWPHADFFVVNVSSPNTPNLRQLQDKAALDEILSALQEVNQESAARSVVSRQLSVAADHGPRTTDNKPILVKVAPDLSFEALDEIGELAGPRRIGGIVATNTTLTRPETSDPGLKQIYAEAGGLSGRPLRARSTEIIRHLYRQTKGALPLIGVGGIFNADDAWEKIAAGASLVQIYTGLVYEGPSVTKEIVTGLRQRLEASGFASLKEAVGQAGDE